MPSVKFSYCNIFRALGSTPVPVDGGIDVEPARIVVSSKGIQSTESANDERVNPGHKVV